MFGLAGVKPCAAPRRDESAGRLLQPAAAAADGWEVRSSRGPGDALCRPLPERRCRAACAYWHALTASAASADGTSLVSASCKRWLPETPPRHGFGPGPARWGRSGPRLSGLGTRSVDLDALATAVRATERAAQPLIALLA